MHIMPMGCVVGSYQSIFGTVGVCDRPCPKDAQLNQSNRTVVPFSLTTLHDVLYTKNRVVLEGISYLKELNSPKNIFRRIEQREPFPQGMDSDG
jgi:hypothetical protein